MEYTTKTIQKKPKAVIFDWDGTLADTRPLVVSALEKTLAHYKLPDWNTIKTTKRDTTKSLKENFSNFFESRAEEAYARYLDTYLKDFDILKSYPGVNETLGHFTTLQIPLFIISNKETSLLKKEIEHLFSDVSFSKILGNGDAAQNKPHPAPVLEALKDTDVNLDADIVWLIGDTKQDTECAYAAGCVPFLIGEGGFMDNQYIEEKKNASMPLNIFSDFVVFLKWLQESR